MTELPCLAKTRQLLAPPGLEQVATEYEQVVAPACNALGMKKMKQQRGGTPLSTAPNTPTDAYKPAPQTSQPPRN